MATFTVTDSTPLKMADFSQNVRFANLFGTTGAVSSVTLSVVDLSHTFPDDLDLLLIGPDGLSNLVLMSDAGGDVDLVNADLTFVDSGGALTDAGVTLPGTYRPGSFGSVETGANFMGGLPTALNHPASAGTATFGSAFGGIEANGFWRFYVRDDASADSGNLAGWSVTVTTTGNAVSVDGTAGNDTFTIVSTGVGAGSYTLNGAAVTYAGVTSFAFSGRGGADTFNGGDGNDTVSGGDGADLLQGNAGNDRFDGGAGLDRLVGGAGNDFYILGNGDDGVSDSAGSDTISSTKSRSLAGFATIENLSLFGTARTATGNTSDNVLIGSLTANVMSGADGADTLIGRAGRDILRGGDDNDRFVYNSRLDSTRTRPDTVLDFDDLGNDRIDLSAVSSGTLLYKGDDAFTGIRQVHIRDIAGRDLLVEVNLVGDATPEVVIRLSNTTAASMTQGDFVL